MRVDFYHLKDKSLDFVIPNLVQKSLDLGKVVIRVKTEDMQRDIDKLLWTYQEDSWLPHNVGKDDDEDFSPILITLRNDNPNNSKVLFLVQGAEVDIEKIIKEDTFLRVLIVFSDMDITAKEYARELWLKASKLIKDEVAYYKL